MPKFLLFLFLFFHSLGLFAQTKFTISGTVKDAKTGETLIFANIQVQEQPSLGATTNDFGFYSLTVPQGKYNIVFSLIGYEKKVIPVNLTQNTKLNVNLSPQSLELKEVEVTGEKADRNVKSSEMSTIKIDVAEANKIPVLFGERDIVKTVQLLPGIKSAGEGNSGFYVRGGGADQNLILLDGATVYNPSHLLGFFSVFNSDALKDVNLIKGGMAAEYGGRISSVLDIKMNDGNSKKFGVSGGIGLIASRLTLEGPIVKDKGSFMISGRRTYADLFLKLSSDETARNSHLYFYDLNMKANYQLGEKDRLYLSGYFGRDDFGLKDLFGFVWGNATTTLRWNHLFSEKLFLNSSAIYSNYNYKIGVSLGSTNLDIKSSIQDYNLKEDFTYYVSPRNTIKFGLNSAYHIFAPGEITLNNTAFAITDKQYALDNAIYVQDEFDLGTRFKINAGIRLSNFNLMGPGMIYSYDKDGNPSDSTRYERGEIVKSYFGPEPRLSVAYILNDVSSVKASYARAYQYLHLLSNTTSSSPTDIWVPSSNNVKPQSGDQVALGYFRNFANNKYETSVEIYYKKLYNQIDYKNGANLVFNKFVESQLIYGEGRAYGIELFLKKKFGKFNGWIGYTLSRTERIFKDVDNGTPFPARQDRTHDISVVGIYELNPKWSFSGTFVYYTGNAVTFPYGKYIIEDQIVAFYGSRNSYRMPAYNRMDISVTWQRKKTEKFESSWNFSVYNLYARENAWAIVFREKENDPSRQEAVQIALFRMIPSVTYNFKF